MFRLHFTPTLLFLLNQFELWFAKIERDVIARGVLTSVEDLEKKIMRYIRQYVPEFGQADAIPIIGRW